MGCMGGIGLCLAVWSENYLDFGLYLFFLSTYHLLEYQYVMLFHPNELSSSSFMLRPNAHYKYAIGFSVVEYLVENSFFAWKRKAALVVVGVAMVVVGQVFRSGAMWTAGNNFHHLIRTQRVKGHQLITSGLYSFCRHPSYLGWFLWAVGTQVMLMNPISVVAWIVVLWRFFNDRIRFEEKTLIALFGDEYKEYQRRVPVRIPFIKTDL
uniref:Protein-S-isoprenylcysteine O-methyltransferase n=1 Tax=Arcella intermedia TaxID=1963864 RepID=A0A6B2LH77_9EUKA